MKLSRCVPLFLTLLLSCAVTSAETPEERAKTVRVTMNLTDVPPGAAAQFVEVVSKIKTHYTARPGDGLVSVSFENATADEALRYIAQLANLELTYQADGAHFTAKK
jgi:hypothetical protein